MNENQKDALFSPEEIQEVQRNINDPEKVAEFGLKFYHKMIKSKDTIYDLLIKTIARMLHEAFKDMDETQFDEIMDSMEGKGESIEPAFVDWPYEWANAHNLIHRLGKAGIRLTLIELLLMAHDLEYHIGPNLLRLNWMLRRASREQIRYIDSQVYKEGKRKGEQKGIAQAISDIDGWLKGNKSNILENRGKEEISGFLNSLKSASRDQINLDEFRNWIFHRDFIIKRDIVILNFHPAPGRQLHLKREDVTDMKEKLYGLEILMLAFRNMFNAHIHAIKEKELDI